MIALVSVLEGLVVALSLAVAVGVCWLVVLIIRERQG